MEKLFIKDIPVGTKICVKTKNSTYDITVLKHDDGKVLIRGSNFYFPLEIEAWLTGCRSNESIKVGWLEVDSYMLISYQPYYEGGLKMITTSAIESINYE